MITLYVPLNVCLSITANFGITSLTLGLAKIGLLGRRLVQIQSSILFMKTLLAEVKELQLTGEILPHYVFGCLKKDSLR